MPEALKMAKDKMEEKDFLIDVKSRRVAIAELIAACVKNGVIESEEVKQLEYDGSVLIIYGQEWKRIADVSIKDGDAKFIYDYNNAARFVISQTDNEEDWPKLITLDAIVVVPGTEGAISKHQIENLNDLKL